ncbi:MAG: HNH endonuclease [Bacteroidetes bacterium]|nr:HNH endonuclease [Bacteroidota bacterium]MBL0017367.1 HNH endonuclease [Bacteroidota bacterium]
MSTSKIIGTCGICGRDLIEGRSINEHHLKPKTYKGTETVTLHVVCHTKIHSIFTERELLDFYHTLERLRDHPEMEKFIKWVSKKEPDFRDRNHLTNARRSRRH